jgi:hypothetical protein
MAIITVYPAVKTKSAGGYDVVILQLDTKSADPLLGMIDTPGSDHISKSWDEFGLCRDGTDSCNIDPNEPAIAELIQRAKKGK